MSLITELNSLLKPEAVEKERNRIQSEIDALQHQLNMLDHLAGNAARSASPELPTISRVKPGGRREQIRQVLAKTPGMRATDIAKAIGTITPSAYTCMKTSPSTFKKVGKLWYLADAEIVSRFRSNAN